MLHRLTSWEDNGCNDSDFWVSVYDDQKDEVRAVLQGTTRFAGYSDGGPDIARPISDPEVLQKALRLLTEFIFTAIQAAETRDVMEPSKIEKGTSLRLVRPVKHKGAVIAAGTTGKLFWSGAFGQFYDKGYNRPDRTNTRVGLTLKDGSSVYVALAACRLDREPADDDQLRVRAQELTQNCSFSQMTGEKCAWDSENHARALYERTYCRRPQSIAA